MSAAWLTALVLAAGSTPAPSSVDRPYRDGRDNRTLLPQKLINRDLRGQMAPWRLGDDLGIFTVAADTLIGTQLPLDGGSPTPFHGFFFSDLYMAVQVFEGLDVNLNVFVLNTTASGGFRIQSDVVPGLAAHLYLDLFEIGGDPVRFDFVTPDLDLVTLGEGLLIETTPLEGFLGGFRWRGWEAQVLFGGRVFWQQDDLLHFTLTGLDGHVGATVTSWFTGFRDDEMDTLPPASGHYVGLHGRYAPFDGVTVAGEYTARIGGPESLSQAFLLRGDVVEDAGDAEVHLGYQLRYYGTGFGPLDRLSTPTTVPSTPIREDYYVTNSFEYLWATPFFDQWSHTIMLEGRYRIDPVEVFAEVEWWLRSVIDRSEGPPRPVRGLTGELLPGTISQGFYRFGARMYPFEGRPHRLVVFVSNKSVLSFGRVTQPTPFRFIDRPIFFVEAEVRL